MRHFFIPFFLALAVFLVAVGPASGGGKHAATVCWIWQGKKVADGQRVFFRRSFELPPGVASASITVTCDDRERVWINGVDLGMAEEWWSPRTYDVLAHLRQGGRNVIAVEGRNGGGPAGLALIFRATLKDGTRLHVISDGNWKVQSEVPDGWQKPDFQAEKWPSAVVVGKMGDKPWGEVIRPDVTGEGGGVDKTADYQVAEGFKLEQIYQVPAGQGSWVSITEDDRGRLLCSDQYGEIYRVTLPENPTGLVSVKPMGIPLKGAHGLLWLNGVLWVTVNEGEDAGGVWRVIDTNGDGDPDKPEHVKATQGRGEHGPHSLVAAPDGKSIYLVAGNHTNVAEMDRSLVPRVWQEDQLLPRRPDARGHARNRMAPGGWIARFTPDGKNWELFSTGFRNAYDLAFNVEGDIFTYDSDMEWDLGMPWYRPTRICHVIPGSEFGWRNGTGKWPEYYEDSMSSQLDIGPGSPTGVVSGKGAKFPARYQRAVFAMDWTFATLYAIHLTPQGDGYQAEREEFIAGNGLPLTDMTVGKDGNLYFLTGGRRIESALWRVSYTGKETTEPVEYRSKELALMPLSAAADELGSGDRLHRYQARVSIENAGPEGFRSILADANATPWQIIGASLGLARVGTDDDTPLILGALDRLDWASLDQPMKLNWLRAAGLVFIRHGEPDAAAREKVIAKIDAGFPASDAMLNRELCRMLSYLQAPGVVGRTLTLMDNAGPSPTPPWLELAQRNGHYGKTIQQMVANLPPAQVIHYVNCLRVVDGPWHPDERKRFFGWLAKLSGNSGGASYAGFINDLRQQTLETCTPEERKWIEKLDTGAPPNPFANLPEIKGPGREWSVDEIVKLAEGNALDGRDLKRGKDMFRATLCAACHRFGDEGGAAGPDLTSLAGRFTVRDLAESILQPNQVISDQFAFDLITRKDGTQVSGKILEEKDNKWIIATSPFDFSDTIEIEANDIKETVPSPVSPMPPGLINRLNEDELKDLLAYLLGK